MTNFSNNHAPTRIGIDFGTTHTSAAFYNGKAIQAIAKQHGITVEAAQDGLLQATIERLPKDPTFEKQFLKYPATWLNGGCYDDEIEKPINRVATAEDLKSWTPD